jgi:DNA-binding winged helix-turn-helix (wHTH) protein
VTRTYCHLVCLIDPTLTSILSYHLISGASIKTECKNKILRANDIWLSTGVKIDHLSDVYRALGTIPKDIDEVDQGIAVGDVTASTRTSTVVANGKRTILRPITAEIFKLLLLNVGQIVSRSQLRQLLGHHSVSEHNLNLCIFELRTKLGPVVARRIEAVKRQGYRYIEPSADPLDRAAPSVARFNRLNDEFGPLLDDDVLRQLSSMFHKQVRKLN